MFRRALLFKLVIAFLPSTGVCADPTVHWALVAPRRVTLPQIRDSRWPRNAVDRFTLARMEAASLTPSREAEKETLIRRVTLDLTGLPPTADELQAYLADGSPDAYERLVVRLLASPRFGERMAQSWLDLARYADTHGYLIDSHREMWRWRDWVIDAFNQNMPFNQFTIEQLAGDLLPNASLSQKIASGFNRNHMVNYENGAIAEQYRAEYVADRVVTVGAVWLGQTFECARCHDHKYDPFTIRDFYQLFALFNNVPEEGLDGNRGNAAPWVSAPTPEQQLRLDALSERIKQLEMEMETRRAAVGQSIVSWERTRPSSARSPLVPDLQLSCDSSDRSSTPLQGKLAPPRSAATLQGEPILVPGKSGQALLLGGHSYVSTDEFSLPLIQRTIADQGLNTAEWDGGRIRPGLSLAAWVLPTTNDRMLLAEFSFGTTKQQFQVLLERGQLEFRVQRERSTDSLQVRSKAALGVRKWQHVLVTWDGGTTAAGVHLYFDGQSVPLEVMNDRLSRPVRGQGRWFLGGSPAEPGFRGMLDEVQFFGKELSPAEAAVLGSHDPIESLLAIPDAQRTAAQNLVLREYFLTRHDEAFRRAAAELATARREHSEQLQAASNVMVMQEQAVPRETFVLVGGQFDQRGERVLPGIPAALASRPAGSIRNRLDFARWIVGPHNPLTARVMVNRLWQQFFGTGLVRTPEDFGVRGEAPTHPELLDWLAVELVESGWNVKHLVRLMVTSATYRQSSRVREDLAAADPENRLLARASRLRLDAESLRDSALFVSGLLDSRLGGPSVFPYQPPGLWEEVSYDPAEFTAQSYTQSRGRDLYRRTLYTFWKRTLPPPALTIFDAPTRERCTASRSRTNTPLQALVLMNDVTYVEASRKLAERVVAEAPGDEAARINTVFQWVTSRPPRPTETAELLRLLQEQHARFLEDPEAAEALLKVGDSPRRTQLDQAELAAWTLVANVLLSLDETITRN